MTVLNEVMATFFAAGIARDTTGLTKLGKTRLTTRENLVHIRLMSGVPQDGIGRAFENTVQCNGEFHSAKVRTKVSAGLGNSVHDEVTNLGGEVI